MSDLGDLYQSLIMDHNRKPRNYGVLAESTHVGHGHNPLCGDKFTVFVKLDAQNIIESVFFNGEGCAISKASASLMTTQLKGKTLDEAQALFARFHAMVTDAEGADHAKSMGKLGVFVGVREYPARVKCATLAWHTFHNALAQTDEVVATEV